MKKIHMLTFLLLVVGGLNWLLVGLFGYDLVASIFGAGSPVARLVYILVGLSALYELFSHKQVCKACIKKHKEESVEEKENSEEAEAEITQL